MNAYNIKIRRHYTDNKLLNNNNKKLKIMGNILYAVAVILVIAWAIGFLGYHAGGIIHILLVIAVIAVILRIIQGKSIV
ncbi:MAG TPA: lmo0937 family membrane protein [Chitinophagales bacterium]|nr:lmo0937 family membrane protein [Chitinophagales bacterium]